MQNLVNKLVPATCLTALLLLSLMGPATAPTAMATERVSDEYQVQAAYILNFVRFTTWPTSSFRDEDQDIILGIQGEDFFGATLDAIDGEAIKNRRLQIIRLGKTGNPQGCHLLYISNSEQRYLQQILAAIEGKPTLTISDMDNFAAQGGMIQIKKINDKIKLFINTTALNRAGLKLRANLLNIATLVN